MYDQEEIDPLGWRLSHSVVRGEIDCRERDRITGRIWLLDREFPIELMLRGNAMRDIAGCLLAFENPEPMPEDNEGLSPVQMGVPGIITASRKIHILDVKAEIVQDNPANLHEVRRVGNGIWIEWFSNANGRVVVNATDFLIQISDFSWRMTRDEEKQQIINSQKAHTQWREIVANENGEEDDDFDFGTEESGWYMDEFEWERQFQESDAISQRYMLLMETFINHPERERIIAHEMGWNWNDTEDYDDDPSEWDDDPWEPEEDDDDTALTPNPATEGVDWIRTPDGRIRHPLSYRATEVVHDIWKVCQEQINAGQDEGDIQAMLFHAQTLNAKLAGALDALAYDFDPDGGFIVACLKRALQAFDLTMRALGSVAQHNTLEPATLASFRDDIFSIRQEILRLMHRFRQLR